MAIPVLAARTAEHLFSSPGLGPYRDHQIPDLSCQALAGLRGIRLLPVCQEHLPIHLDQQNPSRRGPHSNHRNCCTWHQFYVNSAMVFRLENRLNFES